MWLHNIVLPWSKQYFDKIFISCTCKIVSRNVNYLIVIWQYTAQAMWTGIFQVILKVTLYWQKIILKKLKADA